MSALGLEPRTNGLKGHCSSIELRARCKVSLNRDRAVCILSRAKSPVNDSRYKFADSLDTLQSAVINFSGLKKANLTKGDAHQCSKASFTSNAPALHKAVVPLRILGVRLLTRKTHIL